MKFFGAIYQSPIYQECERAQVPKGELCAHCAEVIAEFDDGWILPFLGEPPHLPYHRACFLRGITGSVAHQQKRCGCFVIGSECNDEPALTVREAAEAAVKLWERGR
jgi:hypothetical protein